MILQVPDLIDDHLFMIMPVTQTKKTGIQVVIC